MKLLSLIYDEICKERAWNPRIFISKTLAKLDELLSKENKFVLIARLPTGYGKTSITNVLARAAVKGNPYFARVIHVLPMRNIADDVYFELRKDKRISPYIAVQHLLSLGSPFFSKRCIVTTLDTFLLNFFKLPASELGKAFQYQTAHSEFPRAMIYSSIVIFDEFHLFTGLGSASNEGKALTSVLAAMQSMVRSGVPVLIMSATIPNALIKLIKEELALGDNIHEIRYTKGADIYFDRELEEKHKKVNIKEQDILEIFKEVKEERSVLIVVNTVRKAKEIFESIHDEAVLIHGKMPEIMRSKLVERIKNYKPKVLVATQVVEAGLNISYDVLITEPCPIDRLIQRAGRVCRFDEKKGDVFISKFYDAYPYVEELTKTSLEVLRGKEELSFDLIEKSVEEVYDEHKVQNLFLIDREMKQSLLKLDMYPIFDNKSAEELIRYYRGLTENFGIISCFCEKWLDRRYAIPINEDDELLKRSSVTLLKRNMECETLRDLFFDNTKSISIYLLERGYLGIVIPEEEYIKIIGCKPDFARIPCAFEKQSLIEHTRNTLEKALKMKYSFEAISMRLRAMGLNIDSTKLEKLVKVACILHDIGKLADEYQENFYEDCECKGGASFYLHEVPSAYYAYNQLRSVEDYNLDVKERLLVTLAILFHVTGKNFYELMEGVKIRKSGWSFKKYWKDFQPLLDQYKIRLDCKESISKEEAERFLKELMQKSRNVNFPYLKLYALIYAPICIGDNLDSYESRRTQVSESRKIFIEELYEAMKYE